MPILRRILPIMHRVAILALDAVVSLDMAIPAQVFGAYPELPYRATLCAPTPGPVRTTAGFEVVAEGGLRTVSRADTVIVPGFEPHPPPPPDAVLRALRSAGDRGSRVVSICTGAFALAAAGLLDGRRAATHWRYAEELAARYPAIEVDPDVLYVDEGPVLTSAGVSAGMDLCLHMLRVDHGAELANTVARRVVVPPHRDGGQAQYVERPVAPLQSGSLEPTRAWALERLDEDLTVREMARHAHVSERTFARRFVAETHVVLRFRHEGVLMDKYDAATGDHDRGLSYALPRFVSRRAAVGLLAGGVGSVIVAACGGSDGETTTGASATSSETESSGDTTSEIPEETAGPFP